MSRAYIITLALKLLVSFIFMYLGISAIIRKRISGMANTIAGRVGVYSFGKPYFEFKGRPAQIIGLFLFGMGVLALYNIINNFIYSPR